MATPEELAAQVAEAKAQEAAAKEKEAQEAKAKAEAESKAKLDAEELTDEKFDKDRAMKLIEKLRGEVKELKPLASKVAEYETKQKELAEKDMTELQKAQKRIDELEVENKNSKLRELRRTVGEEAKLPAAIYELLPDLPESELRIKAAELAKSIPSALILNANNPNSGPKTITAEQRRAFMNGGPLPD
jgi:hypothetical protein